MRLLRLLIPCILSFCGHLYAQTPPKTVPVSLEFSLFAWQADLPSLRYSPRNTVEPVESFTRSNTQTYAGPDTLNFYAANTKLPPANGELPTPAATVTLPQGATRVTLITVTNGTGRYRMYAVPEDGDSLPENSIRLHNFTESRLAVAYDQDGVVQLPPVSSAVIKLAGQATVIRVAREENGQWRKLFNNVIELTADGRGNVVLAPSPGRPVSMYSLPAWPRKIPAKATSGKPQP